MFGINDKNNDHLTIVIARDAMIDNVASSLLASS